MRLVAVIVFGIFCHSVDCIETVPYQHGFPIGAIFDWNDVYAKTGFYYAMNKILRQKENQFNFSTIIEDVSINDSFQLVQKICDHLSNGVFALVGSKSYISREVMDSYTRVFHMPYLSPSIDHHPHHSKQFSIFMKPDVTRAIASVINHLKWTKFHYIYDTDSGLSRLMELKLLLKDQDRKSTVASSRRLLSLQEAHRDLRMLDKLHGPLTNTHPINIVFDLSNETAYDTILNQIRNVGMNKNGYSYLLGSLDIVNHDLDRFSHGGVNITGFQLVDHQSDIVQNFLEEWRQLPRSIWEGAGETVRVESALMVDTLNLLRETIQTMIKNNSEVFRSTFRRAKVYNYDLTKGIPCTGSKPWMHGLNIMNNLREISIHGLTGEIHIDENGHRYNYSIGVYEVGFKINPRKIGRWVDKVGFVPEGTNDNHTNDEDLKTLIVTSIFERPFLQYKKEYEKEENRRKVKNKNDLYEGYCVDLIAAVSDLCGGFQYTIVPNKDSVYGAKENGTWTGMIGELVDGKADLAVAPLTITKQREEDVAFSKPFMNSGISIMIKKPEIQKPGVFSFLKPFSIYLWMCIIGGYFCVSFGMFIVSRFSPAEWRRKCLRMDNGVVNKFTLESSLWFTMGALMLQGSDTCPRSVAGRIIGGTWWFAVLIVISSYTANLAAFLTIDKLLTPIENADDLAAQTEISYGTLESGSTQSFFKESKVPTYQKMWAYMSTAYPSVFVKTTEEGVRKVRNMKGKYAVLLESVYNEYFSQREPCDVMQVGSPLNTKGYGIATPKTSKHQDLSEMVSIAILELTENGSLIKMKRRWWIEKGECGVQEESKGSKKKKSLSLSNLAGVFFILISGLVFSIILAVAYFQRSRSNNKQGGFLMLGGDVSNTYSDYSGYPVEERSNGMSPKVPKGILSNTEKLETGEESNPRMNHIHTTSLL
ncbi:glutamate receptor 2-like [Ostrea edulis]|uniref:glutamate receptor 2-like n=1 Tax=Ostrea edulis TaxID=37623 RepID=UPI0024AF7F09|nr:glutamate receptor 2-like [Ostrea edulis]